MRARQWSSTSPRDRKASRPPTFSACKTSPPRAEAWVTLASLAACASEFGQDHKPSRFGRVFSLPAQAPQSPARVFGNHRILVVTEIFQHRQKALIAAVSHRYCHIAAKPVEPGALHWRATQHFAELIHAKPRQPFQLGIDELRSRLEFR